MEAELIKIKSEAGINDTFSIESVINYIKNYKNVLCSHNNINVYKNNNICLNENENCKDFICMCIKNIETQKKLYLNIKEKPTLFSNNQKDINHQINNQGFSLLDRLDISMVDNILKELKKIKYYGRSTRNKNHSEYITLNDIPNYLHYNKSNIHTYFINQNNHVNITDLLNIESLASLIVDPIILKSANDHLGCLPKLQCINSWISFYTEDQNELSFAAQAWHTDNDCHKFFKVFLYLNDVDETNGAHEIIADTKKTISNLLKHRNLKRGEIILPENKKILPGKKGSIILEDTRHLHRGGKITDKNKHRVLLHWWYGSNNDQRNLQYFNKNELTHNILDDYIDIII